MIKEEYKNEHYTLYSKVTEDGIRVYGYLQQGLGGSLKKLEKSMRRHNSNTGISFVTAYQSTIHNITVAALMILEFKINPKDIPNCLWSCACQDYYGDELVIAVEPNFEDVTQQDVQTIQTFCKKHKTKLLTHFNKNDYYFEWYI